MSQPEPTRNQRQIDISDSECKTCRTKDELLDELSFYQYISDEMETELNKARQEIDSLNQLIVKLLEYRTFAIENIEMFEEWRANTLRKQREDEEQRKMEEE